MKHHVEPSHGARTNPSSKLVTRFPSRKGCSAWFWPGTRLPATGGTRFTILLSYGTTTVTSENADRHPSEYAPWLLYDNHADPYQKNNVISNASYAKLLSLLDRSLDARLKQLGDSFLPAAEYLKRDSLTHYREVNVKVGHTRSPWGDWESTLT